MLILNVDSTICKITHSVDVGCVTAGIRVLARTGSHLDTQTLKNNPSLEDSNLSLKNF